MTEMDGKTDAVNPFTYGNPINDPKRFFGRMRELEQIFSRLGNSEFESSSIVGANRMGRTSLLLTMSHPDVVRRYRLDPSVYRFVYAHLDIIAGQGTPTRFYQYVLRRMASVVPDPELVEELKEVGQRDPIDVYDMEDAFDAIDRKGIYIVLLLDDFENLATNQNFGPEFYYGLRSLAIHHKLALVTASWSDLVDLSRTDSIRTSPFFNIFATINLQPFTQADVKALLRGSLEGTGISFQEAEVDRVISLAGRQPFFLQMAFHFLFDAYRNNEEPARRMALVEERFHAAAQAHYRRYWQQSTDGERMVMALLTLASRQEGRSEALIQRVDELSPSGGADLAYMVRRGLVLRSEASYAPFSSAFGVWVFKEVTSGPDGPSPGAVIPDARVLAASLPASVRVRAERWFSTVRIKYAEMFAKSLSNPRSAERVLALLEATKEAFGVQEQAAAAVVATEPEAPVAPTEGVPLLTDREREQTVRHLPPEGIVSILFTDLEGSTGMFQTLGDHQARELLRTHDRILRKWIADNGGYEVKHTGDGLMVVFPSARRALTCVLGIQRELEGFNQEHPNTPLRVRMGLNAGETLQEEQDFFGTAVILAARVMSKAAGGQVMVSELFRRVVGTTVPVVFIDRGRQQLAGFEEEQQIYEVEWRASKDK